MAAPLKKREAGACGMDIPAASGATAERTDGSHRESASVHALSPPDRLKRLRAGWKKRRSGFMSTPSRMASYGPSLRDGYLQPGIYIARVLKGEKPGDL